MLLYHFHRKNYTLLVYFFKKLHPAKERIHKLCNMDDNLKMRREFFEEVIRNKNKKKTEFPFVEEMPKDSYTEIYDGEKDLISVVIPYYNLGKTLPETIESIKETEYKKYEIIIVNDGSTDKESIEVLNNYKNDEKIRIINIENKQWLKILGQVDNLPEIRKKCRYRNCIIKIRGFW